MAKAPHPPAVRRSPPTTIESSRDRERLRTVVFPEHSDLARAVAERIVEVIHRETRAKGRTVLGLATGSTPLGVYEELIRRHQAGDVDFARSEEHTSELQSRLHLVCRLLLEKKNKLKTSCKNSA